MRCIEILLIQSSKSKTIDRDDLHSRFSVVCDARLVLMCVSSGILGLFSSGYSFQIFPFSFGAGRERN